MYPIMLCSVLVIAIFCERLIRYAMIRRQGKDIEIRVAKLMKEGDEETALKMSEESRSHMGQVLEKAIKAKNLENEVLESVIVNASENEVRDLSSYLQTLATIGNIAPLLCLLIPLISFISCLSGLVCWLLP